MNAPRPPQDWSDLLEMLTDRFGSLTDYALDNLRTLLDTGRSVVNCAETGILVPSEDGRHLKFLVSVNSRPDISETLADILVPSDRSIAGCVFNSGQLIALANPEDFYPLVDQKTGLTTRIYLATPVLDADGVLGVLTFVNRPADQPQEPFNEAEIEWSTRLADLTAAGLKYYRRLALQHRLFQAELSAVAERFAAEEGRPTSESASPLDDGESSSLGRVLLTLERMSRREQDLAADILGVLSSYMSDQRSFRDDQVQLR